ncbi:hypothetical protein PIB30_010522 [Stylosanthes scabra]|uniref:Uncharacterized protein n=1 Tax=Stylosanthes scabra TaxID=79078 RepID=A0ABU6Q6B0_9FABA|nr:hypothetical protein [Stylosanthes scabra]
MDGITNLLKGLFQQINPDFSSEQVQAMIDNAQKSALDVNSAPNDVRQNVPPSSGSSYMPYNDEETKGQISCSVKPISADPISTSEMGHSSKILRNEIIKS